MHPSPMGAAMYLPLRGVRENWSWIPLIVVSRLSRALGQNPLYHRAVDIGQAKVSALKPEGQAFVVKPEQVHDGGLKIMHMHLVANH